MVRQKSGEDDVCLEVFRLLGRADVERLGHGERGLNLRRLDIFLLHAEVAFAGCERFLEMFCDEVCAEAWPRLEVAALSCPQESRGGRAEGAGVEDVCKVSFRGVVAKCAVC